MAGIKFGDLVKQTMTPKSIVRSRKAATEELAAMELPKKARRHKTGAPNGGSTGNLPSDESPKAAFGDQSGKRLWRLGIESPKARCGEIPQM
jgi:hypothetical protein